MSLIRAVFPEMMRAIRSFEEPFFHSVRRSPIRAPASRFDFNFPRLPSVDVVETEKEFEIFAEMPGIEKENIQVSAVNGNTLEIRGMVDKNTMIPEQTEGEEGSKKRHRILSQERFSEEFFRSVTFPQNIEAQNVSAELKNGLLQVKIPKAKDSISSIPINVK